MARYELLDEIDLPFPLGGCFGYWGYDLKNFVEPKLPRTAVNDLGLPDCQAGFYDSLVVFDHRIDEVWIVSTGVQPDGARDATRARTQVEFWKEHLEKTPGPPRSASRTEFPLGPVDQISPARNLLPGSSRFASTSGPATFIKRIFPIA